MSVVVSAMALSIGACRTAPRQAFSPPPKIHYRSADIHGQKIFYREAGDPAATPILLLHGYPSSSHTYRELIPLLASEFRVIAPDNLGSGYSARPDPQRHPYTFDKLADHVQGLVDELQLGRFVLYMQDFGAPVGFRLMQKNPDQVIGFVSQNANAYLDGLTEKRREFFLKAHQDRSEAHVESLFDWVSEEAIIQRQYLRDVPKERWDEVSPDAWTHDLAFLRSKQDRYIQVQLFQDYHSNIDLYPNWQELMRRKQYPALIMWGRHDAAFIEAGARAYLRDLPKAELILLDAGHFAVEERPGEVATHVLRFARRLKALDQNSE